MKQTNYRVHTSVALSDVFGNGDWERAGWVADVTARDDGNDTCNAYADYADANSAARAAMHSDAKRVELHGDAQGNVYAVLLNTDGTWSIETSAGMDTEAQSALDVLREWQAMRGATLDEVRKLWSERKRYDELGAMIASGRAMDNATENEYWTLRRIEKCILGEQ